ncbi:AMP-binding protein [Kitasatospora acidiphila]|uniref:AMP-binding protein n=1 Tax=Kitasatospora acidiphila TaxID=2567942 RepID=UPI002B400050|nr:AMP-binding protein [Kitasatospora acidiphila]
MVELDGPDGPGAGFLAWREGESAADLASDAGPDDEVVQLYTSGTTGLPKGVVLAHRSFFGRTPDSRSRWSTGRARSCRPARAARSACARPAGCSGTGGLPRPLPRPWSTAGCTPVTPAIWTPTASCTCATGSRTSSSWPARTSTRPRSRTRSPTTRPCSTRR